MKNIIHTSAAPAAIGPYSQAVKAGDYLFLSGQLPIEPSTGAFAGINIESQTKQALDNLKAIIEAADMHLENVVKVNVYLADMNDFLKMNEVYSTYFSVDCPARAAVQVSKLPKNALVEIEAIAYKG